MGLPEAVPGLSGTGVAGYGFGISAPVVMKILIANLGSTSLKYCLYAFTGDGEQVLARGGYERISDHGEAIENCLATLKAEGLIASEKDLAAVGFKTVLARGVSGCVPLSEPVLAAMEAYNGLAPAHNPPYLAGIRRFAERLPGTPLVGLFETAFYQWAPEAAMRYAVPAAWHDAGVRRYGFHGASHKYIAERAAEMMGRADVAERVRRLYVGKDPGPEPDPEFRMVSCHLGGSSSVTGIRNGIAIGNSLGMSPQSGLPHNNRVGDLDTAAIPYMVREKGLTLEDAERQLCKESGLLGLSGVSNDIRDIREAARGGNPRARLALDVLVHATRHWIGAYFWQLGGLDALVFTAGIGENGDDIRHAVCAGLERVGLVLDEGQNASIYGEEAVISAPDSKIRVMVIPTNEELVVAREVRRHLENA